MIIEGEWRETSLAFIDFIKINYNEDPYDYLKCMGYEIPYINNLKCGILYDYFKSYIELFRFLADIKSDINCLVFAPNINRVNSNPRIPFVTQESLFVNENPVL